MYLLFAQQEPGVDRLRRYKRDGFVCRNGELSIVIEYVTILTIVPKHVPCYVPLLKPLSAL